jgi:hypothetical protein
VVTVMSPESLGFRTACPGFLGFRIVEVWVRVSVYVYFELHAQLLNIPDMTSQA